MVTFLEEKYQTVIYFSIPSIYWDEHVTMLYIYFYLLLGDNVISYQQ